MIPSYAVFTAGVIIFFVTGKNVMKNRNEAVIRLTAKRKAVTGVFFLVSLLLVAASAVSMHAGGKPDRNAKRLISTVVKQSDVRYVSGRALDTTLVNDRQDLLNDSIIEYTDSLYNKVKIKSSDILDVTESQDVPAGSVQIDKCITRFDTGLMYNPGICYRIKFPLSS